MPLVDCSGHTSLLLAGTTGSTVGTLRETERVLNLRTVTTTGEKNVSHQR